MKPSGPAWRFLFLGLLAVGLAGCNSALHSGQGTVRFTDGEPVQAGSVELRCIDKGIQYASKIDRQGAFQLASQQGEPGLPPGEYEAVVVLIVMTEHLAAAKHQHGHDVPARYADYGTSGLKVQVESPDSAPIQLVLEPQ